jgi:hypothetical protein
VSSLTLLEWTHSLRRNKSPSPITLSVKQLPLVSSDPSRSRATQLLHTCCMLAYKEQVRTDSPWSHNGIRTGQVLVKLTSTAALNPACRPVHPYLVTCKLEVALGRTEFDDTKNR